MAVDFGRYRDARELQKRRRQLHTAQHVALAAKSRRTYSRARMFSCSRPHCRRCSGAPCPPRFLAPARRAGRGYRSRSGAACPARCGRAQGGTHCQQALESGKAQTSGSGRGVSRTDRCCKRCLRSAISSARLQGKKKHTKEKVGGAPHKCSSRGRCSPARPPVHHH